MELGSFYLRFEAPLGERQVYKLRADLLVWLETAECPGDATYRVLTVVDELFCNTMEHAGARWASLEATALADGVRIELKDDGVAFDPTVAGKKDYSLYLNSDTDRNLGLYLVMRTARSVKHARDDAGVNSVIFELDFVSPRFSAPKL